MTDSHHETHTRPTQGPGRLLREAREQARISVDDLSALVKLSRSTIDALERDDFNQLSETVYVRGYYRKLAKVLPVAEADLLRAYEAQVVPKAPMAPSKLILAGGQELGSGPRIPVRVIVIAVITGLLLGAIALWVSRRSEESSAPLVKPAATAPTVAGASPATASAEAVKPTASNEAAPGTTPEQQMLSTPAATPPAGGLTAAENQATAAEGVAAAPGDAKLDLVFVGSSWTEVKDARGKTLLSGVIPAGATRSLSGNAPLAVFLGNAPGVQLSFNGAKVDMSLYTTKNNTARFKLP